MTSTTPGTRATADTVTVRYFAAAKAAAGRTEEQLLLPDPAELGALLDRLRGAHGEVLSAVLQRCSYLIDEVAAHDGGAQLRPGAVVDVLPPFAGG
ncbi:MoaD/ThiS family protein [Nakamurella lactea]|uniref:MoaD/ThiS family protein n=1 Tax=Nakamurella lactea TaxID=459515 RepID=UPI00048BFE59|nr:MoaD/ThiS family protein [Nakamurella lactea]